MQNDQSNQWRFWLLFIIIILLPKLIVFFLTISVFALFVLPALLLCAGLVRIFFNMRWALRSKAKVNHNTHEKKNHARDFQQHSHTPDTITLDKDDYHVVHKNKKYN